MDALTTLFLLIHAGLGLLAGTAAPLGPTTGFDWPLHPTPTVVHPFEAPPQRWAAGHRGVDLSGAPDQEVLAAGDGVITHSGVIAGRGTVTVTRPDGRRTTYEPLEDRVATGTRVRKGQRIGTLAAAGHCTPDTCLHWGLLVGPRDYRDPLTLLRPSRVVLLPL